MAIIVKLAKNYRQRATAYQLVRNTYLQKFNVDIDNLHFSHPEKFKSDVLMAISTNTKRVLGTMSVMYPNRNGIFPCESLFGFKLSDYNMADHNYVEIGRFATSEEGKKNIMVVIALFLGAIKHLQNKQIEGWTATVKDDVFDFLQKGVSLPLNSIEQTPVLQEDDPLWNYIGNTSNLHLFNVSLDKTAFSFQRFEGFLTRGVIDIQSS